MEFEDKVVWAPFASSILGGLLGVCLSTSRLSDVGGSVGQRWFININTAITILFLFLVLLPVFLLVVLL